MERNLEEVIYKPNSNEVVDQKLNPQKDKKKSDTFFLYCSAITVNFIMFSMGCALTWPSPVLPKLTMNDSDTNPFGRKITTIEVSMLSGIPSLSAIVGTLSLGRISDKIGRKMTIQYATIIWALSNIVLSFGTHIYVYYFARSVFAFVSSIVAITVQVYLSEISEDHNRGRYGCLMAVFVPMGDLYSYLLGPVTTVRNFTLLCTLPLVICCISLALITPESPVYLAMQKDRKEAIQVLTKLRNNKSCKEVEMDYENIELALNKTAETGKHVWSTLFSSRIHRKALVIVIGTNLVQQFSGATVITIYLAPIFNSADTQLSGNAVAILVGIVKMFSLLLTTNIVEKLGKRPLILTSSFLSTISLFFLGLYFYWKSINVSFLDSVRWLPTSSVLAFIVAYSLGLGSISLITIGDIFPGEVKSAASSLTMLIVAVAIGTEITIYPMAEKQFGIHSCLWSFSICTFLGLIFIYFMFPETKGKNYSDIKKMLEI